MLSDNEDRRCHRGGGRSPRTTRSTCAADMCDDQGDLAARGSQRSAISPCQAIDYCAHRNQDPEDLLLLVRQVEAVRDCVKQKRKSKGLDQVMAIPFRSALSRVPCSQHTPYRGPDK